MPVDTLIIIPAYNEAKNISRAIKELQALDIPADIAVIDDGSNDLTGVLARSLGVAVLHHPCNLGYGAALQTGFKYGVRHGYMYVIQFDGDGQHQAIDVKNLWKRLKENDEIDTVIGSRFLGDSAFNPGMLKKMAICIFRRAIKICTGHLISDPTSGLRGLKREVFSYYAGFNRFPADYPDADFLIDLLLHRWSVDEIPISNRKRDYGISMHSGFKPLVYLFKVSLSIFVNVVNHLLNRRETSI